MADFVFKPSRLMTILLMQASEQQGGATPWDTLRFLIGEAMYGGRVSDNFDRRVLATYLAKYLDKAVLEPSFTFYSSGNVIYRWGCA
jgi:dynein heavy chain, axonemal